MRLVSWFLLALFMISNPKDTSSDRLSHEAQENDPDRETVGEYRARVEDSRQSSLHFVYNKVV